MRWLPGVAACGLSAILGQGVGHCAPATADDFAAPATVAEIIVTAQKREENLERVPIAISAYTSRQRDLIGVDTVQDLAKFTPGLVYSTSTDRAYIRGVGRQTNNLSTQPGVATYFDGVYNSSISAASGDSLFVDRVEVLRGPQGTLYGKNAIGGAINSISRRPTDDLYAEARAKIGNYGVYDFEAAVSGPITDRLRFRLAGYRDDQEQGYFKNLSGLRSEGGAGVVNYLEGQLAAQVGSDVDVWVKAYAYSYDVTLMAGNLVAPYDTAAFGPGNLSPDAAFGYTQPGFTELGSVTQNPGVANPRNFSTDTTSRGKLSDAYSETTELVWHTPWAADLKYIGGYTQYLYNAVGDADDTSVTSYVYPTVSSTICAPASQCPPLTVFPTAQGETTEQKSYFSNELDLSSNSRQRLQWIAGLYQYHDEYGQELKLRQPFQPQLATPFQAAPNPSRDIYDAGQKMTSDSYAAFGQVDWSLTGSVKLSGGLRYTYDKEAGVESTRQLCFGLPACEDPALLGSFIQAIDITRVLISFAPAPGVVGPPTFDQATGFYSRRLSASWSAMTGTAGIEWTPDPHSLIYAKYSRGYKAGGFNSGPIFTDPEAQPETLDAYEVGIKREFGQEVRINSEIFYYNYYGVQIPLQVVPPTPAITEYVNASRAVSYGLEVEGVWTPVRDLELILSYAYLNAKVRAVSQCFVDGADPTAVQPGVSTAGCPAGANGQVSQNVTGQVLPQSPPNKVLVAGNYTWRFDAGALTLSADYAWTDKTYDSIFNRAYYLAPAFNTVDARLLWNDREGRYTVILYAKNIFNALTYDSASASQNGDGAIARVFGLGAPATYGVELQYRFR